jgi:FtsZ-interacting cell division protein ZipA
MDADTQRDGSTNSDQPNSVQVPKFASLGVSNTGDTGSRSILIGLAAVVVVGLIVAGIASRKHQESKPSNTVLTQEPTESDAATSIPNLLPKDVKPHTKKGASVQRKAIQERKANPRLSPAAALQAARSTPVPRLIYKYACQVPRTAPEYKEARGIITANTAKLEKLPEGFLEAIEAKCTDVSLGRASPEKIEQIQPTPDGKGYVVISRTHSATHQ